MSRALRGLILFTVTEVITLVAWLIIAGLPFNGHVGAVAILIVGLFIEHYFSIQVGAGRPLFSSLPPDEPHGN